MVKIEKYAISFNCIFYILFIWLLSFDFISGCSSRSNVRKTNQNKSKIISLKDTLSVIKKPQPVETPDQKIISKFHIYLLKKYNWNVSSNDLGFLWGKLQEFSCTSEYESLKFVSAGPNADNKSRTHFRINAVTTPTKKSVTMTTKGRVTTRKGAVTTTTKGPVTMTTKSTVTTTTKGSVTMSTKGTVTTTTKGSVTMSTKGEVTMPTTKAVTSTTTDAVTTTSTKAVTSTTTDAVTTTTTKAVTTTEAERNYGERKYYRGDEVQKAIRYTRLVFHKTACRVRNDTFSVGDYLNVIDKEIHEFRFMPPAFIVQRCPTKCTCFHPDEICLPKSVSRPKDFYAFTIDFNSTQFSWAFWIVDHTDCNCRQRCRNRRCIDGFELVDHPLDIFDCVCQCKRGSEQYCKNVLEGKTTFKRKDYNCIIRGDCLIPDCRAGVPSEELLYTLRCPKYKS